MATVDVTDERVESTGTQVRRSRYRRGLALGAVGGVAVALLGAVAMNPAFTELLRSLAGTESRQDDSLAESSLSDAEDSPPASLASFGDDLSGGAADKAAAAAPPPQILAGEPGQAGAGASGRVESGESEDAVDSSTAESREIAAAAASTAAIEQLTTELRQFANQVAARLEELEKSASDASVDESIAALRSELMTQVEDLDARIDKLDAVALDYETLVTVDLPELRKAIGKWQETVYREESAANPEVDQARPTTDADQPRPTTDVAKPVGSIDGEVGTLLINNDSSVAGWVRINDEPVWLKVGVNELNVPRTDVVVSIPNGGATWRLDAGLWQRDGDRYVMERKSWPP